MVKRDPESPWLPLLRENARAWPIRMLSWLRNNTTWLIGLAALVVSICALYRSEMYARSADARLRRERRPWLSVAIADDTLAWDLGTYYASYKLRNVGKGPALWLRGMSVRLDTRLPVASYGRLLSEPAPTRMLAPGESIYMQPRAYLLDAAPKERPSFYVHYLLVYGGIDREDTFFLEQVFYVNTIPAGPTTQWPAPRSGPERAYVGIVKKARVLLDGDKTPDQEAVVRANEALSGILSRKGPKVAGHTKEDSTRLFDMSLSFIRDSTSWAMCSDSLRLRGLDNDAIEYSRAYAAEVIRLLRSGVPPAELDSAFLEARRGSSESSW